MQRLPLYYCNETKDILKQGLYICLTDPDDLSKPFVNKNSNPLYIYTSDLKFYTIEEEVIKEIPKKTKDLLIQYDVPLFILLKNNALHIISNPVYDCAYSGSEFEPCSIIYNFDEDLTPDYESKDIFDNPKKINVILEFNGKKELNMIYEDSIKFLIFQLEKFKEEYNYGINNGSDIIKLENKNFNIQNILIYDSDKKYYLADYTIGVLLASHILIYINDIFQEFKLSEMGSGIDVNELLRYTCSSFVPADKNLIVKFTKLLLQLPENFEFNLFLSNKYKCENDLLVIKHNLIQNICDKLISYYKIQL
jgi:hypothetical protein